jgi:hypothetical protein
MYYKSEALRLALMRSSCTVVLNLQNLMACRELDEYVRIYVWIFVGVTLLAELSILLVNLLLVCLHQVTTERQTSYALPPKTKILS